MPIKAKKLQPYRSPVRAAPPARIPRVPGVPADPLGLTRSQRAEANRLGAQAYNWGYQNTGYRADYGNRSVLDIIPATMLQSMLPSAIAQTRNISPTPGTSGLSLRTTLGAAGRWNPPTRTMLALPEYMADPNTIGHELMHALQPGFLPWQLPAAREYPYSQRDVRQAYYKGAPVREQWNWPVSARSETWATAPYMQGWTFGGLPGAYGNQFRGRPISPEQWMNLFRQGAIPRYGAVPPENYAR